MLSEFPFSSNTTAGLANQHYFLSDGKPHTARAYFKVFAGGEYDYSLLFSGILDGSYRRISFPDEPCSGWVIHSARIGRLTGLTEESFSSDTVDTSALTPDEFISLTFHGEHSVTAGAELFPSDPIRIYFDKGDFLCLELCFSGDKIPCHPECVTPIYELVGERLVATVNMPLPCMVGANRPIKERIGYLGDSITQGVGTDIGSYKHWNALLSDMIGDEYSYWNLGIGYGKASDVAEGITWFSKAASCDTLFVCFGVNDINGDGSAEQIKGRLSAILERLRALGKRVIFQTVPPYDYPEPRRLVWEEVNRYITEELAPRCDRIFDVREVLSLSPEEPHKTRFGGHPNAEGCALWARALYKTVGDMFP